MRLWKHSGGIATSRVNKLKFIRWKAVCDESRMHGLETGKIKRSLQIITNVYTASIFTIFSHHANTPKDLVLTLRNSLVNDGGFSNMETAEKQVTDVVKVDIHLDYTPDGKRYIDKISEIIQLEEGTPYPEYDEEDATHSMNKITAEYYQRKTDRVGFKTHTILQYDLATHTYFTVDRFSPYLEEKIRKALGDELVDSFDEFMLKEWGPRAGTEEASMTQEQLDKRISDLHERIRTTEEEKLVAQTVPAYTLNENMTGEQIEEDAAERDLWKEGYSDGQPADIQNDFELGSFFSDDDYS